MNETNEKLKRWVDCPICGGGDMLSEPDGDEGHRIIHCTNLCCASNGGDNDDAWKAQNTRHTPPAPETTNFAPISSKLVDAPAEEAVEKLATWIAMRCSNADRPLVPEMKERFSSVISAAIARERENTERVVTQLGAWYAEFGTGQLTHASARLQSAEKERDALRREHGNSTDEPNPTGSTWARLNWWKSQSDGLHEQNHALWREVDSLKQISHAAASDIEFMLSGGELMPETMKAHIKELRK